MSRYIDADQIEYDDLIREDLDEVLTVAYWKDIKEMPTADVRPVVRAKNISKSGFLCSACSFGDFGGFYGYEPEYCPNCGAKIEHRRMTVAEVKTKMCDNYCRHFARIYATFEDIDEGQEELDKICKRCPLNDLEEVSDDN